MKPLENLSGGDGFEETFLFMKICSHIFLLIKGNRLLRREKQDRIPELQ
jgi:hypothetical protein